MKLKIHKFLSIEDLTLEIPAQIAGGNGTGKTTILEAISFCLTGKDQSGNEFKQVYDNRVDLHDAIADVSYFDSYGNEYRRIVSPVFQTTRAGVEEIKIKRNTVCKKNDIAVNDYASDFADFYKFGTDFFFRQKEDIQRSIFIDTLKSKMPDYDIQANSLKKKELDKAQKNAVAEIKRIRDLQKNTKDVEVPEIEAELKALNDEYLKLASVDNSGAVSEINKRNNALLQEHYKTATSLNYDKVAVQQDLDKDKRYLIESKESLLKLESKKFTPSDKKSTDSVKKQLDEQKAVLEGLKHYPAIEDYAKVKFTDNPVLVGNQKKIREILALEFVAPETVSDACPLSGEACETARLHSESSYRLAFKTKNESQIDALKQENRSILTREMNAANDEYYSAKRKVDNLESELAVMESDNLKIDAENKRAESEFNKLIETEKQRLTNQISELEKSIKGLELKLSDIEKKIGSLAEPTLEKLPEEMEISEELKAAHKQYEEDEKAVTGAKAINENNAKNKATWEAEVKAEQAALFEIDNELNRIKAEISEYFSNLSNLVKTEFAGEIEIGVELLEYVITKDEYKDCFKITANGKVFPYECNGALQNNVKLQILSVFQRLNDYKGITIIDNCEANTTQEINLCGLNCVYAIANMNAELKITN